MDPNEPNAPQNFQPAPAPAPIQGQSDQITFNDVLPLVEAKGWLKFIGILNIIMGVLYCLTCFGAIIGWIFIWMGIVLKRASNNLNNATLGNTGSNIYEASRRIRTFFTIVGVLSILGLIGMVLQIIYFVVIIIIAVSGGFENMQNAPY